MEVSTAQRIQGRSFDRDLKLVQYYFSNNCKPLQQQCHISIYCKLTSYTVQLIASLILVASKQIVLTLHFPALDFLTPYYKHYRFLLNKRWLSSQWSLIWVTLNLIYYWDIFHWLLQYFKITAKKYKILSSNAFSSHMFCLCSP